MYVFVLRSQCRSGSLFAVLVFPQFSPMDLGEGPSQSYSQPHHAPNTREDTIQLGHTVLLKIPSGDIRTIKLEGNVYASNLLLRVLLV